MDTEQLGAWEWVRGSVCADACEGMALVRCPRQAACRFATLRLPSLPFAPPRSAQVLYLSTPKGSAVAAFVQLRGSVPIFWEQRGKTVNPKPRVSRVTELTAPALRVHLEGLAQSYAT